MPHVNEVLAEMANAQPTFSVSTGLRDLDELVRPLQPGQLWAIIGEPDTGRTTLALQWALALAPRPVSFISVTERLSDIAARAQHLAAAGPACDGALAGLHVRAPWAGDLASLDDMVRRLSDQVAAVVIDDADLLPHTDPALGGQPPEGAVSDTTGVRGQGVPVQGSALGFVDQLVLAARRWCLDRGLLVVLALPRQAALVSDRTGVERVGSVWSRAVDVTVETCTGPAAGPGTVPLEGFDQSTLFVWSNRWGPSGEVQVVWAPWRGGIESAF